MHSRNTYVVREWTCAGRRRDRSTRRHGSRRILWRRPSAARVWSSGRSAPSQTDPLCSTAASPTGRRAAGTTEPLASEIWARRRLPRSTGGLRRRTAGVRVPQPPVRWWCVSSWTPAPTHTRAQRPASSARRRSTRRTRNMALSTRSSRSARSTLPAS